MSAPQLTPELLAEPAARAARTIAQARLDAVQAASARLGTGDAEALHDVRVALRRMRSWLQAYRPALDDTVTRRSRLAFRKLARASNDARDAEVALAWLEAQTGLPPEAARDYRGLVERVAAERAGAAQVLEEFLASRLPAAVKRLERQLASYWVRVRLDGAASEPKMARLTAKLLTSHVKALAREMKRAETVHDVAAAHRTRIAGKQLRYLLEPLDSDARAAAIVARLTALQDRLGEFRDAQLLAARVLRDVDGFAVMLEVAGRAQRDSTRAFTAYRRSWNSRTLAAVVRNVTALADDLAERGGGRR